MSLGGGSSLTTIGKQAECSRSGMETRNLEWQGAVCIREFDDLSMDNQTCFLNKCAIVRQTNADISFKKLVQFTPKANLRESTILQGVFQ